MQLSRFQALNFKSFFNFDCIWIMLKLQVNSGTTRLSLISSHSRTWRYFADRKYCLPCHKWWQILKLFDHFCPMSEDEDEDVAKKCREEKIHFHLEKMDFVSNYLLVCTLHVINWACGAWDDDEKVALEGGWRSREKRWWKKIELWCRMDLIFLLFLFAYKAKE